MVFSTKAQRAQISLGDIPLNVYLLSNGHYALAGRNITDAVEMRHGSLAEIMRAKTLKALPSADLSLADKQGNIKAESGEFFCTNL